MSKSIGIEAKIKSVNTGETWIEVWDDVLNSTFAVIEPNGSPLMVAAAFLKGWNISKPNDQRVCISAMIKPEEEKGEVYFEH